MTLIYLVITAILAVVAVGGCAISPETCVSPAEVLLQFLGLAPEFPVTPQ